MARIILLFMDQTFVCGLCGGKKEGNSSELEVAYDRIIRTFLLGAPSQELVQATEPLILRFSTFESCCFGRSLEYK